MEAFGKKPGRVTRADVDLRKSTLEREQLPPTQRCRQKFRVARHFGDNGKDGQVNAVFSQMARVSSEPALKISRGRLGSADVKNNPRTVRRRHHSGTFTASTSLPFSYR